MIQNSTPPQKSREPTVPLADRNTYFPPALERGTVTSARESAPSPRQQSNQSPHQRNNLSPARFSGDYCGLLENAPPTVTLPTTNARRREGAQAGHAAVPAVFSLAPIGVSLRP